jgi:hypothetical protein
MFVKHEFNCCMVISLFDSSSCEWSHNLGEKTSWSLYACSKCARQSFLFAIFTTKKYYFFHFKGMNCPKYIYVENFIWIGIFFNTIIPTWKDYIKTFQKFLFWTFNKQLSTCIIKKTLLKIGFGWSPW